MICSYSRTNFSRISLYRVPGRLLRPRLEPLEQQPLPLRGLPPSPLVPGGQLPPGGNRAPLTGGSGPGAVSVEPARQRGSRAQWCPPNLAWFRPGQCCARQRAAGLPRGRWPWGLVAPFRRAAVREKPSPGGAAPHAGRRPYAPGGGRAGVLAGQMESKTAISSLFPVVSRPYVSSMLCGLSGLFPGRPLFDRLRPRLFHRRGLFVLYYSSQSS